MMANHTRDIDTDKDGLSCDKPLIVSLALKELVLNTLHASITPLAEHVTRKLLEMKCKINVLERG